MIKPQPFTVRPGFGEPPVGSVIAFAGALGKPDPAKAAQFAASKSDEPYITEPLEAWGWMLCDGRELDTYDYHQLFCVLGYLYGGSGSQFKIPDYRGTFLRGTDLGSGKDPDAKYRKSANGDGQDNPGVGSLQKSALQQHQHQVDTTMLSPGPSTAVEVFAPPALGAPGGKCTENIYENPSTHEPARPSDGETRPINTAVNYIIKFTYGLRPHLG